MGAWVHRLTDVDVEAKTGTCASCGPVSLKVRKNRSPQCLLAYKEQQRNAPSSKQQRPGYPYRSRRPPHGLTLDERDSLIASVGRCEVCGDDGILVVDHDHETGRVRGVLCNRCNSGLGFFRDNPDYLVNAVKYLEEP